MAYEVVIVGGGIGGLTAAALLAARGVRVCLVEREAEAGGCAAPFEHSGYLFEPGAGLYAAWQPGEVHERVFAELQAEPPEARKLSPSYVVRLPDGADVRVGGTSEEFEAELRAAFPECVAGAARFYREAFEAADALHRAARKYPPLTGASKVRRLALAASEPRLAPLILSRANDTAARHLSETSARFRRFVDAQLQTFAQTPADSCSYLYAAVALAQGSRGLYALRGGARALTDALVAAIKSAGGVVRLGAHALRLAYDSRGRAAGVELLSGETVEAARAVVSNLTVWDTYGKLVGAARTPAQVRARLKASSGRGAYLIFLGLDEEAAARLPSEQLLAVTDSQDVEDSEAAGAQLMFGAAPRWDARAPEGMRAATLVTFTDAERWFAFHEDETEHEEQDARELEKVWERLHAALPELGAGCEVIETATPRTFYERTRRRLGTVGAPPRTPEAFGPEAFTHRTAIPNLFLVGDTVFPGAGVAAATHSALIVADELAPRR